MNIGAFTVFIDLKNVLQKVAFKNKLSKFYCYLEDQQTGY